MSKISSHGNMIVKSQDQFCHECILRWLPRNKNIDNYIRENQIDTIKTTEKIDGFQVQKNDNSIVYKGKIVPIHPECTKDHAISNHNKVQELSELFTSKSIWYQSLRNNINSNMYDVVTLINAPISSKNKFVSGWGSSDNYNLSQKKSFVEAIERFHTYLKPTNLKLIYGTERDFYPKSEFLHFPKNFISNSKNLKKYSSNLNTAWVEVVSLITKNSTYIPIDYLLLKEYTLNNRFMNPTSTGIAGHFVKSKSLRNGFLEYIERYGQYIFWIENNFKKIKLSTLRYSEFLKKLNIIESYSNKVHVYYKSIFNVHVVIIAIETEKRQMIFSSAGDFIFKEALLKSIDEGIGQWFEFKDSDVDYEEYSEIKNPIDHLKFYLNPKNISYLESYINKDEVHLKEDPQKYTFEDALLKLQKEKIDVLYVDRGSILTKCLGVYISQIFIPQLPYLTFDLTDIYIPNEIKNRSFYLKIPHPFS